MSDKTEIGEMITGVVDRTYGKAYDQAIEHSIVTIKDFYNGVFNVPSDIDEIIKKLENLKSK